MRKKYLINGMGCNQSGGKLVLDNLIATVPDDIEAVVIYPFRNLFRISRENSVTIINLNHKLFGVLLRIPLELSYNFLVWSGMVSWFLNLSNYDFLFSRKKTLYFHNPYLLDLSEQHKISIIKKIALKISLKYSRNIIVQTDHMREQLSKYCLNHLLECNNVTVLKPSHNSGYHLEKQKPISSHFQLFYPASSFQHKRVDLAIESVLSLNLKNINIRFNITVEKQDFSIDNENSIIEFLGKVSHREVVEQFTLSHALLFTSERETLGLPLLEALNLQIPSIIPDLAYAREIYGEAGVYFSHFTKESISSAIIYLIENYDEVKTMVIARSFVEKKKRLSWQEHWNHFYRFDG